MGYDQYTVPDDSSCRTYFCCFPLALANICPWSLVLFFQISLKNSELKTTHNTYRDCRVHFFRQPFSKQLYMTLLCVGITRYPRVVRDMETSVYPLTLGTIISSCSVNEPTPLPQTDGWMHEFAIVNYHQSDLCRLKSSRQDKFNFKRWMQRCCLISFSIMFYRLHFKIKNLKCLQRKVLAQRNWKMVGMFLKFNPLELDQ